MSEQLQYDLSKLGIGFVMKKGKTLHSELCKLKIRKKDDERKNGIYCIKNSRNKLWLAVGMDGNHHLMLLGWGLCSVENKTEWQIFQTALRQHYGPDLLAEKVVFISDRQKGSLDSFAEVFSNEYAALQDNHDTNHLENNMMGQFKCRDILRQEFQLAVNSYTLQDKLKHTKQSRRISPSAATYLEGLEHKYLFRADAEFPNYGMELLGGLPGKIC
jgi:hypothetical protein